MQKTIKTKAISISPSVTIIGYDKYNQSPYVVKTADFITNYTKLEMMDCFGLTYLDIENIQKILS